MKKDSLVYWLLGFVLCSIGISSYLYPTSRDEFYYLSNSNYPNPFLEYYNSYFFVNPRLGQFFSNVVGRNLGLKPVFNILLFYSFVSIIYLNVFRNFPKISQKKEIANLLLMSAGFIFLINYFGEMFYYVPFNTNYTFTHLFYLLYVFLLSEYYFYSTNPLKTIKIPYFIIVIMAFFMGMCNEHVPPILIAASLFLALLYLIREKKLPNFKILFLVIPVILGYFVLFFAPANRLKFKGAGTQEYGFQLGSYLHHFIDIAKIYFYYNTTLVVVFLLIIFLFVLNFKKIEFKTKRTLVFLLFLAVSVLLIVAYSPLQGTRLLFFSNSLFILFVFIFIKIYIQKFNLKLKNIDGFAYLYLILFFCFSVFVTYHAHHNFETVMQEIANKSKMNNRVELNAGFDYGDKIPNNRKILLETGKDYIDENLNEDTSVEKLLKNYFGLQSLNIKTTNDKKKINH